MEGNLNIEDNNKKKESELHIFYNILYYDYDVFKE